MADSDLTEPHSTSTGAIYDVLPAQALAVKKKGEWNSVEIILDGPRYKNTLNGIVVQDVNFDDIEELKYRLRRGYPVCRIIMIMWHSGISASKCSMPICPEPP